jgi:protein translocase SecG subunit
MDLQPLAPYLSIAEIVLAVAIITLVLLQSKGSDLGGFMGGSGGDSGGYRTKRGVEATMHRVTIYFCIAFFIVTLLTFIAWGQAA